MRCSRLFGACLFENIAKFRPVQLSVCRNGGKSRMPDREKCFEIGRAIFGDDRDAVAGVHSQLPLQGASKARRAVCQRTIIAIHSIPKPDRRPVSMALSRTIEPQREIHEYSDFALSFPR